MELRIKELMGSMTQQELAERMQCSIGQVNQIISGKRGLWVQEWLPRLANALGVEVYELFLEDGSGDTVEAQRLLDAYRRLSGRDKQMVDIILFPLPNDLQSVNPVAH